MALAGEEFTQFSYFINNQYEPKRKNRFMLHIASIPVLSSDRTLKTEASQEQHSGLMIALIKAKRPTYTVEAKEIPRFNEKSYYAGAPTHDKKMACSFNDYINDADISGDTHADSAQGAGQILYRWFQTVYNLDFGSMGFKKEYSTTADLFMLDPHGRQIEHWHYTNFWITETNYGDVDFGATDHAVIECQFQYDKAKLISSVDSTQAPGVYSSSEFS